MYRATKKIKGKTSRHAMTPRNRSRVGGSQLGDRLTGEVGMHGAFEVVED